jgi:hypothetical protein
MEQIIVQGNPIFVILKLVLPSLLILCILVHLHVHAYIISMHIEILVIFL